MNLTKFYKNNMYKHKYTNNVFLCIDVKKEFYIGKFLEVDLDGLQFTDDYFIVSVDELPDWMEYEN